MKYPRRTSLAIEDFESYMRGWVAKKPECVTVDRLGVSSGYDVWGSVFTDRRVSDEDKQMVLVTAQHSHEISGVNTCFSLGNWLASSDPDADEILKHIVIVLIPCPNPYVYNNPGQNGFWNEFGVDEYNWGFTYTGVRTDGKAPSSVIIQRVIDKYRPELILDVHGVWYDNQIMCEGFGTANSRCNTPYNSELIVKVNKTGMAGGHYMLGPDQLEMHKLGDDQIKDRDVLAKFIPFHASAAAQSYAYVQYHTIGSTFEIAHERNGVNCIVAALKEGLRVWPGERYAGYPTRCAGMMRALTNLRAYGVTAEQRRKSRIEIWQQRDHIIVGAMHPEMPGTNSTLVITDAELRDRYIKGNYESAADVFDRIRKDNNHDIDVDAIEKAVEGYYIYGCNFSLDDTRTIVNRTKFEYGMVIRIICPYPDAKVNLVMYNGKPLKEDDLDGYSILRDQGATFVDINIPAEKIAPFAIATVKYDYKEADPPGIINYD